MQSATIADFLQESIDFLIIGGGTAGLVLAARLSEDPNVRVGVVEAGLSRLEDPNVELPTGAALMLNNADYDWKFQSVPQIGTKDKVYHIPRGKMLGGSSAINYMAYGRPCAADIDDWSQTLGVQGWSWADLLPYFRRSENLETDQPNIKNRNPGDCPIDRKLHGVGGPIHTSMATWQVPFEHALLSALDETSGIPRPEEPCGGKHLGFFRSLFTTDRTGKPIRSYSGNGYLVPNAARTNLRVLTGTVARKIISERDSTGTLAATGVELEHGGASYIASARREIILCAGTFQSPQLLELSGIGDPIVLEEARIPCVVPNTDVGNNLQERTMSAVVYELADGETSLDSILRDPELLEEHRNLYAEKHTGAMSGAVSLMGYIPYSSQVSKPELEHTISTFSIPSLVDEHSPPQNHSFQTKQREAIAERMRGPGSADIQIVGTPATFDAANGVLDCTKLMTGAPVGYNACYSLVVSNMYPLSRGNVHIPPSSSSSSSYHPNTTLLIDPGLLSHPADVDVLLAGLNFADTVFRSSSLADKVARRLHPPPDLDLLENKTKARAYVREHVATYHHALGTCALGRVVDERLRVKGIRRLRVVDASVLPMQVSAAIMATVYAVAEKAADSIKEDYRDGE